MTDQEQGLKRELTARQMAMVAVGGSIGTGLLLGSGAAIQVAGPAVVLTFVLSALISWTVAMALGEMSAVHPAAGSFGVYADLYVNRWAGFIARYRILVCRGHRGWIGGGCGGHLYAPVVSGGSGHCVDGDIWPFSARDQLLFRRPLRHV